MTLKKCFLLPFLLIFFVGAEAQQNNNLFSNVIPPSPDAASLGKFVDIPVGVYNGVPEISIPLDEISVAGTKIPISLSYHAGGIKVSEIPSWVGLGWALNAGGVITRSIHGKPDEISYLYGGWPGDIPYTSNCLSGSSSPSAYDYSYAAAIEGTNDTEPDMFYYNFNGITGKFVFDRNGNVHTIPYSKIKIESNYLLKSWKITTETGVKYTFDMQEKFYTRTQTTESTSSWYLTKIEFPSSSQTVDFSYQTSNYAYDLPVSETRFDAQNIGNLHCGTHSSANVPVKIYDAYFVTNAAQISRINYPGGNIEFIQGNYRYDFQGGRTLKLIKINDNKNNTIKSYNLLYKYFSSSTQLSADDGAATSTTVANTTKRLCLQSVQETSGKDALSNPPYIFSYYVPNVPQPYLPDRLYSNAQDHWGYYNGENLNTTLIPEYVDNRNYFHSGAKRYCSEEYTKTSVLNKIQYPTGGFTTLEYEQNDAESDYLPNNINVLPGTTYYIGMCNFSTDAHFSINDEITQTANVTLTLGGNTNQFGTPYIANCGNNSAYPVPDDPNTFIFFEVYNITNSSNPFLAYRTTTPIFLPAAQSGSVTITLPNGTYEIRASRGLSYTPVTANDAGFGIPAMLTVSGYYYTKGPKKVGGLRIKKMDDFDPVSNKIKVKTYDYSNGNLSSGAISYIPKYQYTYFENNNCTEIFVNHAYSETVEYTANSAFSNSPLTQMQGSFVGYGKVTVIEGDQASPILSNGKTENYFSNPVDLYSWYNEDGNIAVCYTETFGEGQPIFPFTPSISAEYRRGQLTRQVISKYENNTFLKVKEIVNTYKEDYFGNDYYHNSVVDVKALKVGINYKSYNDEGGVLSYSFKNQYYYVSCRLSKLTKTEESIFDELGTNPVINSQDFFYDNMSHLQLTKSVLHKSDGNTVTTQYLYPLDYTNTTGFIGDMKAANIISKPIETVSYLTKHSDGTVSILNGNIVAFKQAPNLGLPGDVKIIESSKPIPKSQFTFSNQAVAGTIPDGISSSAFSYDSHYSLVANQSASYDSYGHLIQTQKRYDMSLSYLWDYNNTNPIAMASNASQSSIAYTSFEADGIGNWTFNFGSINITSGVTGTKSYTLGSAGPITKTGLPAGSYIVSYWLKNISGTSAAVNGAYPTLITSHNGWSLYQKTLTNISSITISGTATIDDIRLYPVGAQMTTYTYDPLVGMTSQTDPSGKIIYYEYDGLNRLKLIRDQDNKIIKQYDYQYQQPQ